MFCAGQEWNYLDYSSVVEYDADVNKVHTDFGIKLKALREARGLSMGALAKLTGLTTQAISSLESQDREPAWFTVQMIALALEVDYRDLADLKLKLPEPQAAKRRGRPRKAPAEPAATPRKRKPRKAKD